MVCSTCRRPGAADDRFCSHCGAPLQAGAPRDYTPRHLAEKILRTRSALEGERKVVTVLFADVKDSLQLARALDPEAWHRILDRFFSILAAGIHRFEGTINQYTGDGVMALFGAPVAHENHAERACHAAHQVTRDLQRYGRELYDRHGLEFGVRLGLNSGDVVVGRIGDDLRLDYTAQGSTVGLAARMEERAAPGETLLAAPTAALVEGFFELDDRGVQAVEGVEEPVRVYALGPVGALRTRLDAARARGFSRLVGRAEDLAVLERARQGAARGHGLVLGVVGEAGVGKSRLCTEFALACRERGDAVYEAHCPAHGADLPGLVQRELLRSLLGLHEAEPEERTRVRVEASLRAEGEAFAACLPLVLDCLEMADRDAPTGPPAPEARRAQLADFVRRLVGSRAARGTTLVLMDDVHWIDAESERLLEPLAAAARAGGALLLLNFRPEYRAPWIGSSHYLQLPLGPLAPGAIDALLGELLGSDPALEPLASEISARSGGNPLFIEETVRDLAGAEVLRGRPGAYTLGRARQDWPIPGTVQPVLASRIDRLAEEEKALLQLAAVVGLEFTQPVLERAADRSDDAVALLLSRLQSAELIDQTDFYPVARYAFRHPLTREVAYRSRLRESRADAHAAVALAIEAQGERLGEQAALIAQHWEAAGDPREAAVWQRRAALRVTNIQPQRRGRRRPRGRWA